MGDYGQVQQTFEEFAGRYIDDLYHGALFLNGGEEPPAEDLVLWTLTGAFQEFRQIGDVSAAAEWIEEKLVEVFLVRAASGWSDDGSERAGWLFGGRPVKLRAVFRYRGDRPGRLSSGQGRRCLLWRGRRSGSWCSVDGPTAKPRMCWGLMWMV